jgi:hypothetical protein
MNNLNDIFDLGDKAVINELKEKKPRKKVELSEDKKNAMLERLAKGREVRAMKLKEKKGIKEEPKPPVMEVKEQKEVKSSKIEKEVKPSINEDHEKERIAFINNLMGKANNKALVTEKYERPKKKIQAPPKDVGKPVVVHPTQTINVAPVAPTQQVVTPVAPTQNVIIPPIVIPRAPVVIRNFIKAPWA